MKALFAFKLVVPTYSGPVVNLRRSDNTYSDFYSDTSGNLYTNANNTGQTLTTWLSGLNAYVTRWYDQSGLVNDLLQTNTTYQPQLITTDPKGLCVSCTTAMPAGSGQLASTNNIISGGSTVVTGVTGLDIFTVFKTTTTSATSILCTFTDSTSASSNNGFHSVSTSAYWDVGARSAYFNGTYVNGTFYKFNGYNNAGANGFFYTTPTNPTGTRINSGNATFSTGPTFGLNFNTTNNYNKYAGTIYWAVIIFSVPLNGTNDETLLINNFP